MDAPTVFLNNKAFIDIGPIPRSGIYQVEFWRSGYLNKTQNLTVEITEPNQRIDKYVIMSPELTPGQTRLIYTWQTESPGDVDLHVHAIKNDDDNDVCTVFYANKDCPATTQDRDNVAGGLNGPETVTFQDPAINSLYTYLVAIDDWEWENNGDDFFNSGSSITVLNQIQSHDAIMVGSNGTATETFYFFGCVNILPSGNFTFTDVPQGIFFNGNIDAEWLSLRNTYC